MINLLSAFRSPTHSTRLNFEFLCDLAWWREVLTNCDGVSFFPDAFHLVAPRPVCGDRCCWVRGFWGNMGYRLICRSVAFGLVLDLYHPSAAFAPVVAAHVWGNRWHRLNVQFLCDNAVVVAIYIPGHRNAAADALSRLHFQEFPGPDLPIVGLQAI